MNLRTHVDVKKKPLCLGLEHIKNNNNYRVAAEQPSVILFYFHERNNK